MNVGMTAIRGTINQGVLIPQADLNLFADGTEVIVIAREDFNVIAGSDSTRFQLQQAQIENERLTALLEVTV